MPEGFGRRSRAVYSRQPVSLTAMPPTVKLVQRLFCLIAALLTVAGSLADEVILVASPFPKEVLSTYKQAFEQQSPNRRVEFVNFPATRIVSFLRDRAEGSRPDVFWGSSPDAFRMLRRNDLLEPLNETPTAAIPPRIGRIRIDDAEGYYLGQALSGYGIMWNTRYLSARRIAPPTSWDDLTQARYFGHVVMSSPSRSSTTHLIIESILQGKGWHAGWTMIMKMAGNAATITERSFDVPNNITRGRFGVGPVVDFLALSGKSSGFPVDFCYPWPNVVTPASIGLIRGARNPEGGRAFIRFTRTEAAQRLLLRPEISRLPVLPSIYGAGTLPSDFPKIDDIARNDLPDYAPDVSDKRYRMVNAIFDQTITFRHRELNRITAAIHAIEETLHQAPNAHASELIEQAKALVYRPPIDEDDAAPIGKPRNRKEEIAQIAGREAEWSRRRSDDLATAYREIARARQLLERTP